MASENNVFLLKSSILFHIVLIIARFKKCRTEESPMARRGRPTYSKVRQNVIEILYVMGEAYGYQIYKAYKELFPTVTLRP